MNTPEPGGLTWRKSSYSGNGSACVEVAWRTSSYSGNGSECLEVAWDTQKQVCVRDSKDPDSGIITVSAACWRVLMHAVSHRRCCTDSIKLAQ